MGIILMTDLVNYNAARIVDFYGDTYPYVFVVPSVCLTFNEFWVGHKEKMQELNDWCSAQGFKQHRSDLFSVIRDNQDSHRASSYMFDNAGGSDAIFFAFSDIENFSWFCLRWGYVAS